MTTKLFYTFSLACILMACGSPATQQQEAAQDTATTSTVTVAGKPGDPVCEMPYDTSYQEWSVYKGDTVHFCSATCKGVFDKNPDKYAVNLK